MEEIKRLAEAIGEDNVEKNAREIWTSFHKKYVRSFALQALLNISQMALAGSIVALNIYVTRYASYQTGFFVAVVVLMSVITLMNSLAIFLKLRARARRNRIRYVLAVREASLYRDKKGYYSNPKNRDERIVKRLSQIRAWKNDPEHADIK